MIDKNWFYARESFILRVRTKAPSTKLVEILPDGAVKMDVHAVPSDNEANVEIIKYFKRFLGRRVSILVGKTSKEKVMKIIEE